MASFGYTFSQLRYVVIFKTIDHARLILLEFAKNAMSHDTRWRHDCVTTLDTSSPMALCILQILGKTKFVQWPKWTSENPCTKFMGFWRQEEKKNQNKSNTFSAALEAAEKLKTRDLCLLATEHRAFPQSVQVMMSPWRTFVNSNFNQYSTHPPNIKAISHCLLCVFTCIRPCANAFVYVCM